MSFLEQGLVSRSRVAWSRVRHRGLLPGCERRRDLRGFRLSIAAQPARRVSGRGRGQARDDCSGTAQAPQVAMQCVRQATGDTARQNTAYVAAFNRQAVCGADHVCDPCLGEPLGETPGAEIGKPATCRRNRVVDHRPVVKNKDRSRPSLPYPDAQFRFLTTQRAFYCTTPKAPPEPASSLHDFSPERHIGTHKVAHWNTGTRSSPVCAPDNPVELVRE